MKYNWTSLDAWRRVRRKLLNKWRRVRRKLLNKWRRVRRKFLRWWLINSSRVHLQRWNEKFAERVKDGEYVLDAGAGNAPYRSLFSSANYETADFEMVNKKYFPSTYVCDLQSIPVEDERFHHIVFNQVMEHLPNPIAVLEELRRVLKPGGTMICTCPLFYAEHEQPYDFFRYTQFAHHYLFERAGFHIELLDWMEGYFGTVGYQMECIYKYLPVHPSKYPSVKHGWVVAPILLLVKCFAFVLAGVFYRLDIRFRYTATGLPKNYVVFAKKCDAQRAERP